MLRFKLGDAVYILPKFAHLYPSNSGTVFSATPDPERPMFNVYVVTFADGSNATLFEFQIIENRDHYKTLVAVVSFDSRRQLAATQMRGQDSDARIVLEASKFDLDIKIQPGKLSVSMIGQILERDTPSLLKQLPVSLMKEGMPISTTTCDDGIFKFRDVPRGSLNILISIPGRLVRILGAFNA